MGVLRINILAINVSASSLAEDVGDFSAADTNRTCLSEL